MSKYFDNFNMYEDMNQNTSKSIFLFSKCTTLQ